MKCPPKKDPLCTAADIGKRVGGALYVHKDALRFLSEHERRVKEAEEVANWPDWNVAKIEKTSVSLLLYESFDADFPVLLESVKIHLPAGKITRISYRERANPPILHRKELLLPPDDPRLPRFRALTRTAEDHGLFANPNRIGTRAAWNAIIANAGLLLHRGRLVAASHTPVDVARHRTAIVRRDLSQPMQLMIRFGIVTKSRTIFDYGCGQGEDIAALCSEGYRAFGWDPHHAPNGTRSSADVVNLGFVLNVIEDQRERVETLKSAWGFARQALCVGVMRHGKVSTVRWKTYGDGVLTSRGTFQKYFHQQELNDLVAQATGQKPLALASGIVVAFRDKELEQEIVLRRHSRALLAGALPKRPVQLQPCESRSPVRERLASVLDALSRTARHLGRLPEPEEAPADAAATLLAQRVAWPRAIELLRENLATDEVFRQSVESRRKELLVRLALMQFPGAPTYRSLPRSIQADIKAFFRSHSAAQEEGRRLLFAAGERSGIRHDIEAAVAVQIGGIRNDHWFRFRSSALDRLPARLRVLVGCAEVLQGGVDAYDFVDIDLEGPRIVMVNCNDVEQHVPFIMERVMVDLARLKVSANKYDLYEVPLYFKSRFMPAEDKMRAEQIEFERSLVATGLFPPGAPEPSWHQVNSLLSVR